LASNSNRCDKLIWTTFHKLLSALWDLRFEWWWIWRLLSSEMCHCIVCYKPAFQKNMQLHVKGRWRLWGSSETLDFSIRLHGITSQKTGIFWVLFFSVNEETEKAYFRLETHSLLFCGLFYDTVSISDYIVLNIKMTDE
jgi:hypothetical protein